LNLAVVNCAEMLDMS